MIGFVAMPGTALVVGDPSCHCPAAQRHDQFQHLVRVLQALPVGLADLAHAVANGLRVDEQFGGHRVAPAEVQQPRTQGLNQTVAACNWNEDLVTKVVERFAGEYEIDQVLLSVQGPQRQQIGELPARSNEPAAIAQATVGPTTASTPETTASNAGRTASGTSTATMSSTGACSESG